MKTEDDETENVKTDQGEKLLPALFPNRCKSCGICAHFCPKGAIETDEEGTPRLVDPEACNACRRCEELCPDFAIELIDAEEAEERREDRRKSEEDRKHADQKHEVCHPLEPCED